MASFQGLSRDEFQDSGTISLGCPAPRTPQAGSSPAPGLLLKPCVPERLCWLFTLETPQSVIGERILEKGPSVFGDVQPPACGL